MYKHILITGGAGFVGSNLALFLKQYRPKTKVTSFDNLKRRGSELNLERLREGGVNFVHGDVRFRDDLFSVEEVDLVIDCAAEPSVLAGINSSPQYLLDTNLNGAINCFEFARINKAAVFFVSTSRVYPYDVLNGARFTANRTRFDYAPTQEVAGLSSHGISEQLPLHGARSLYGATKLSAELLLQEYAATYGVSTIVNRFGCIAGPWQMGKTDQGVLALWVFRHLAKQSLSYVGFGGLGKQVRDFIHIDDACYIINQQIDNFPAFNGKIFNIGGGKVNSVSLRELTTLCQKITGQKVALHHDSNTRLVDLKNYISDNGQIQAAIGWQPKHSVEDIVRDTALWMENHYVKVSRILG